MIYTLCLLAMSATSFSKPLFFTGHSAEKGTRDSVYTPQPNSAERKAMMDALRVPVEKELRQEVIFVVSTLNATDTWAFLFGVPKRKGGKPIDYKKTAYRERVTDGTFDDNISALLKKKNGKWTVVTYSIGDTDVVWSDWDDRFKAPPEVFGKPAQPK